MLKEDMIYDIVVRLEQKVDNCATKEEVKEVRTELTKHIKNSAVNASAQQKLAVRKWAIIASIITTVCGAVGGIIVTIFK